MVKIKLLDEKWMEDTINGLLGADEGITDLEKDVCMEKGYQETDQMIRTIEGLAAGTPTADMLVEYKDAIESKAGYEYTAAYLNGIKKGFQLAMFIGMDKGGMPHGKDQVIG